METIWKILILAGVVSAAIFLQIVSCFAFGNNWCSTPRHRQRQLHAPHDPAIPRDHTQCGSSCCTRLPLFILAPMLLTPIPMLLVNTCSSTDAFSESPAGINWAVFLSAFFFTGCFAIPILLALTDSIQWGAALTSLAGTLILCALAGVGLFVKHKESSMLGDSLLT